MKKRYGKIRFGDIYQIIIVTLLFGIMGAGCIIFNRSVVLIGLIFTFITVHIVLLISTLLEKFSVEQSSIITYHFGRKKVIEIPNELLLIFSYADLCLPFRVRTAIGNETQILRNKIGVSILKSIPVSAALDAVHRNGIKYYTTSSVKCAFDEYLYIYSFVCDEGDIEDLIKDKKCTVIMPKSFSGKINIKSDLAEICIDDNC